MFRLDPKVGSRATDSFLRTSGLLRRHWWLWPAAGAGFLAIVAVLVNASMEAAIRQQAAATVQTTLNTGVTAMQVWWREQEINAESLVLTEKLPQLTKALVKIEAATADPSNLRHALTAGPEMAALRTHLAPYLKIFDYQGYLIVSSTGIVLASQREEAIGVSLDGYRKEFFHKVLTKGSAVSKPFRSPLLLPDEQGELRAGLPTMFVASPIFDGHQRPIAVLGLRLDPNGPFTEILRVASLGETGETYAFDSDGVFLTRSRADDELKAVGLLADLAGSSSALTLEVRDPGVELRAGHRPAVRRADQPLTYMAAEAIAGRHGVDVQGYRNYQGARVIGAWTWLPEQQFGVATEVELAEAFRPMLALRIAFWSLMGILGVSVAATFVVMRFAARQQKAMREAVVAARQLGQYTLEDKIGAGGMGTVYKARHHLLRRPTAVKLVTPDKASEVALARFEREVQLTCQLNHPNTIAIYDYGRTDEGIFYYAMEYLDGMDLEVMVKRFGPMPEARVIHLLQQVCGSLAEAHQLGLIHRDIKPGNILVNFRGGVPDFVKVLDFGLAKALGSDDARLTSTQSLTGTPLYLAPEAIDKRFGKLGPGVDLYAVGAVGYYLVTGTHVFSGSTVMEVCHSHLHVPPEDPAKRLGRGIDPGLAAVLMQCLQKSPEARPSSAQALADTLATLQPDPPWTHADALAWWLQQGGLERTQAVPTVAMQTRDDLPATTDQPGRL